MNLKRICLTFFLMCFGVKVFAVELANIRVRDVYWQGHFMTIPTTSVADLRETISAEMRQPVGNITLKLEDGSILGDNLASWHSIRDEDKIVIAEAPVVVPPPPPPPAAFRRH